MGADQLADIFFLFSVYQNEKKNPAGQEKANVPGSKQVISDDTLGILSHLRKMI